MKRRITETQPSKRVRMNPEPESQVLNVWDSWKYYITDRSLWIAPELFDWLRKKQRFGGTSFLIIYLPAFPALGSVPGLIEAPDMSLSDGPVYYLTIDDSFQGERDLDVNFIGFQKFQTMRPRIHNVMNQAMALMAMGSYPRIVPQEWDPIYSWENV